MSTRAVFARYGLQRAIPYALCRATQRVMLLDITHVMIADAKVDSAPSCSIDIEFSTLTAQQVRKLAEERSNDLDATLAYRLDLGYDFCFAGFVDGQLAGYCWIATNSIEARHNRSTENHASGIAFSFAEDHCFRYKGFTHPNFRGRRIYAQISAFAGREMLKQGVRYTISTAEAVNYGALKSSYRCGYQRLGTCTLVGWGDHVKIFTPDLSGRSIFMGPNANPLDRRYVVAKDSDKAATNDGETHPLHNASLESSPCDYPQLSSS